MLIVMQSVPGSEGTRGSPQGYSDFFSLSKPGGWPSLRLPHNHYPACSDHQQTDHTPAGLAERHDFLQENENRDGSDPEQVHHTPDEQQEHQHPAATQTENAVLQTHPKRTPGPRFPMLRDELDRAAAVLETLILDG